MPSGGQALLPTWGAILGNPGLEGVLPTSMLHCSYQHYTLPLGRDGMPQEAPWIAEAGARYVSISGKGLD